MAAAAVSAAAFLALVPMTLPATSVVAAASAAPCPEIEVIFARGREEPAGPGLVGKAFVNSLRSKLSGRNIGFYAVNYPANVEVVQGANDMSNHIQYMAKNCPDTRLVLGGYSLGAAVTDVVVAVPAPVFGFESPLPLGMDDHVAAVVLFGNGTRRVLGPVSDFSPLYGDKTIDLCNANDPICSNTAVEDAQADWPHHLQDAYIDSGLVNKGAAFAAARL